MASRKCRYYSGNIVDAEKLGDGGWFVGHFVKARSRHSRKLEVKSWHFKKGPTGHCPKKLKKGVWEFTLILEGEGRGVINGDRITLGKWDCFVIPPGICNNFPEYVSKPMRGITVKAPSIPTSKASC
jgi:mannose-6-phosphate isomerase-like protein (cupin superfamily)